MDEPTDWPFIRSPAADALRRRRWEETELGPAASWPQSLRSAVQSMLANPDPAFVHWGPKLRSFYNDAYRPMLGNRFPAALGAPLEEVWPELEDDLAPAVAAIRRGVPYIFPECAYPVPTADGRTERRWFRGSWWPLRDEDGAVRGFCGTTVETTDRVLEERARAAATDALEENEARQAFLHEIAASLRSEADPRAAMAAAAGVLGQRLGVAYVGYAEVDEAGMVRTEAEYHAGTDIPSFAGQSYSLDGFGTATARLLRAGHTATLRDIRSADGFSDAERAAMMAIGVQSYVATPVVAEDRLESYLFAAHDGPREWSARDIALVGEAAERTYDAVRRARTEAASRQNQTRYRALFEAIDAGFCINEFRFDPSDGRADYRVLEANPAFYKQTGFPEEILGRWLRAAAPELEEHWYETYGRVALTGEPVRFERHSELLGRWFDVYAFRIDDAEDLRIAVLFTDISDRKHHERQTEMLLREINHRSKNILGLVQAIARQTSASNPDSFMQRFEERVQALAAAQDVLIRNAWGTVPLNDLVRSQLAHFSDLMDARIEIDGPDIPVTPDSAQTLAMALHELATNAAKYGALSNGTGQVRITWTVGTGHEGERGFTLTWQERGGPPVTIPEQRGFGSRVTVNMVEAATGGTVSLEYGREGVCWSLSCPERNVFQNAPQRRGEALTPRRNGGAGNETKPSVLIVEDDPVIAADVAGTVEAIGYHVLGPARDVPMALALLAHATCDAALLDMNLGDETSERVAARLETRGIPYIIVSGYARTQLPSTLRSAPMLGKPLRHEDLKVQLERALFSPRRDGL